LGFKKIITCFLHNPSDVLLTEVTVTPSHNWRKMAFEDEVNGMKKAFLKVGRRRLVLPATLFRLLREKGSK